MVARNSRTSAIREVSFRNSQASQGACQLGKRAPQSGQRPRCERTRADSETPRMSFRARSARASRSQSPCPIRMNTPNIKR